MRARRALFRAAMVLQGLAFSQLAAAQGAPPATPAAPTPTAAAATSTPPAAAAAPAAAPTADQIAKAKTLFDLGAKAYDSEQFSAAIQAFKEAYRLSRRPGPLFSIGQAYRRLYNVDRNVATLREAISYYQQYLEKQKTGGRVTEAQQAIRDLEPLAGQLAVTSPGTAPAAPAAAVVDVAPKTRLMVSSSTRTATASLDGGEPAEMPLIQELPPGKHTLRIAAEGFVDDEREILAAEGQVYGLDIVLRERPAILTVRTAAGADIIVDGRSEGLAPLVKPLELSSGSHLVTITKVGHHPYSAEIDFKRDEKRALDITLERTPQRYAAFVSFSAAALCAVTGVTFVGLAYHEQNVVKEIDAFRDLRNITEEERAIHERALGNREDLKRGIGAAFGTAGLFTVIGAALYAFDRPVPGLPTKLHDNTPKKPADAKRANKVDVTAMPILGPAGGGGVIQVRF